MLHPIKLSLLLMAVSIAPAAAQPIRTDPAGSSPEPSTPAEPLAVAVPAAVEAPAPPLKKVELKPGGYAQFDTRRILGDTAAHDSLVRRLRFKLDGSAGKYFKFRTLIDFAGSRVQVLDAWAEFVLRPEFQIRVGKDKAQFGIERLQSATQMPFIERAFPTQLAPNRDIGVWARGDIQGGLVRYALGAVDGVANNALIEAETDDVLEFNARLLVSPFAKHEELGDLGIGGAATFGRTQGTAVATGLTNLRSASQASIVSYATDAMNLDATAVASGYRTRFTGHAYYYTGPVGVLAEYVRDREPIRLMGETNLIENSAWQLAASAAVTPGDKPTYKGLKPVTAFDPSKGTWGAIELKARYSELRIDSAAFDLNIHRADRSVQRARELAGGGNWYFNEFVKLQLDYTFTTFNANGAAKERESEHLIAARIQASI